MMNAMLLFSTMDHPDKISFLLEMGRITMNTKKMTIYTNTKKYKILCLSKFLNVYVKLFNHSVCVFMCRV
jgi:hypothetical protein